MCARAPTYTRKGDGTYSVVFKQRQPNAVVHARCCTDLKYPLNIILDTIHTGRSYPP